MDLGKAIALLEVQALTAAVVGLDAMLKAADVRLVHIERRLGGRMVTIVVDGGVSDVTAAAEAGKAAAGAVGKVKLCEVISNPHPEIIKFIYTDGIKPEETGGADTRGQSEKQQDPGNTRSG